MLEGEVEELKTARGKEVAKSKEKDGKEKRTGRQDEGREGNRNESMERNKMWKTRCKEWQKKDSGKDNLGGGRESGKER